MYVSKYSFLFLLGGCSKSFWQEHKVPLTRVHRCHLLDYDSQIIPIVLAHCQYSLRLGEGQNVTYDLPALEKHLLNRFIYGKPLILSDIPQVQYKKDVYTSGNFAVIRKNVSPQVKFSWVSEFFSVTVAPTCLNNCFLCLV